MKLHVRMLEKLVDLPECNPAEAAKSPLRHLLDDLGLEVKGVECSGDRGVTFTVETLANRGDHLYALGVAREISGRTLVHVRFPPVASQLSDRKSSVMVRRNTEKCPVYALMEMSVPENMPLRKDVAIFVDEPGKRHAIVDVLNYVQQEVGQPMHAFDFDKIDGEIIIDLATKEETVEALDGKTYRVPKDSILIRDRHKIVAVGGVIGCENSMVTESTRKVLIEAAAFDPISIRKTARAMGIGTEASYFFERGCDPEAIPIALKRTAYLAGGSAGVVGTSDGAHVLGLTHADAGGAERRQVAVHLSRIRKQLNLPKLDDVEILARLKNLGYHVETTLAGKDKIFTVTVPSWRLWDVADADDLVEDVARSISLSRVRSELPPLDYEKAEPNLVEQVVTQVRPVLQGQGFIEVMSKGFYSAQEVELLARFEPQIGLRHLTLKNALEQSNSHMKVTNLVHLSKIIAANMRRGVVSPKVFEVCRVFTLPSEPISDDPRVREELDYNYERDVFTFAAGGRWLFDEFRRGTSLEEFARLFTGTVSSVISSLGESFSIGKGGSPFLHPGVQASVKCGRLICGYFGRVHPEICEAIECRDPIFYCELEIPVLAKERRKSESPVVSDFPVIRRDITLKVQVRDTAGKVLRYIQETNVEHLNGITITDDFKKPDEQFRRVTYRITFQARDRTLQHAEVDSNIGVILEQLRGEHGIEMAG